MSDSEQTRRLPRAKFATGILHPSPHVLHQISLEEWTDALTRHSQGDWGEIDDGNRQANEDALRDGGRLFSVYRATDGTTFRIITEADRSMTSILLAEDY